MNFQIWSDRKSNSTRPILAPGSKAIEYQLIDKNGDRWTEIVIDIEC